MLSPTVANCHESIARSYATKAFENDNNLVGMGLFLKYEGFRSTRSSSRTSCASSSRTAARSP